VTRRSRKIGASRSTDNLAGEHDLMRLMQTLAREAAQEVFNIHKEIQESLESRARAPSDPPVAGKALGEGARNDADQPTGSGERLLSLVAVADQLGISIKSVRRKIVNGELPAHRVGGLLRVGESGLAAYRARTRLVRGRG
jgi:excisionase family DNA binding protein